MNRLDFFKRIGAVSLITVVAPTALLSPVESIIPVCPRPRYSGITREHIKEAVEYVFRDNPYPKPDRQVKLIIHGEENMKRFHEMFKEEVEKSWPI